MFTILEFMACFKPTLLTEVVVVQNCLVIAGASQQCIQCVEKCEKTKPNGIDGGALVTNCATFQNR